VAVLRGRRGGRDVLELQGGHKRSREQRRKRCGREEEGEGGEGRGGEVRRVGESC
jgi:hypothetical protein